MNTLRRGLRIKFEDILKAEAVFVSDDFEDASSYSDEYRNLADKLAEVALDLLLPKKSTALDLSKAGLEWQIAAGLEIKQEQIDEAVLVKEATDEFERALHFNPLPWISTKKWESLSKFVVQEYRKDKEIWKKYDAWRKSSGKFAGAMNNKNIKLRPDDFIACFPDFLAHTQMYGQQRVAPDSERKDLDDHGIPFSY